MSHVLRVPWGVSEGQEGGDSKRHWDVLVRDAAAEDGRDAAAADVTRRWRMKLVPATAAL